MHSFDLGGEEGDRGGWRDGLRAEGDEVGVVGGGEGVDGFGGGEGLLAEGRSFAARCGVENEDAVGKGGGAGVAAGFEGSAVQPERSVAVRIQPVPPDKTWAMVGHRVICGRCVYGGIVCLGEGACGSSRVRYA